MGLAVGIRKEVQGFSLDVEWAIEDELAVLFGYSGAGKSLTLQSIAGLMKPDEGYIRLNGKAYFDSSSGIDEPPQKRPFGYVFQDLALFPHMTVRENIVYGGSKMERSVQNDRAREMIELFRLKGLEKRLPAEISGGQKQRVALARALMGNPDALLLDEPFSALDYPLRLEMRRFLKEVKARFSVPVVLVTHDVAEAYELADRVIVYSGGKVIQAGSPGEIFLSPACREVESLVCCGDRPGAVTACFRSTAEVH